MLVKELSGLTGISRHSLDNYLSTRGQTPSADAAVKIARTLGVSVEFLVTGHDYPSEKKPDSLIIEINKLTQIFEKLSEYDRKIVLNLTESLRHR